MWFNRDLFQYLESFKTLPIKVLKGPRQCGKTSLLEKIPGYQTIYFDDLTTREFAQENPRLFLDQHRGPHILDEASLAPALFLELKRRVDEYRRTKNESIKVDYWITGSNQTLLQKNVQESLAGRATYMDLNTLSLHELKDVSLRDYIMKGGWPELHIDLELDPVRYINDLISTFIEKDIVSAAGIEKKMSFSKTLHLAAGRTGQLFNASDIAKNVSADVVTIQSWLRLLEDNAIVKAIAPYSSNLNQRLIKTPKYYFMDVGLGVRLQGWSDYGPLEISPAFGPILENLALSELMRFFINNGQKPQIYFLRTKDKVEIDFLIELPNQRFIAAEVKSSPRDISDAQIKLLDSLQINVIDKWILSPVKGPSFKHAKTISFYEIWDKLQSALAS